MQVATQDHQIRIILAKLELVSHGTVQAWNSAGGHETDGPLRPPGESRPPHLTYRAEYAGAESFDERQDIIGRANTEWADLTGQSHKERPVGETQDEFNQRIVDEGEGLTAKECTIKFKCSEKQARGARRAHEVNVENGKPLGDIPDENADAATRARAMKAQGMTVRQIGMNLRKAPTQIQRWLKAA